ncbi:MAG: acyltransferase domain-containing protein [Acidobacteria bacterium]|nr:acyltransferase domain-containing protein [Acidobacteriota bacterium]
MSQESTESSLMDIALIGMAGRFPRAKTLQEFWQNVRAGVNCVTFFTDAELESIDPDLLNNPRYVKAGAVLEDIELFDAAFFGYTRRDAEITDPQQRIFLECAWEAVEHAGYDCEVYDGRIGVFAGASLSRYLLNVYSNPEIVRSVGDLQIHIGNKGDHLATRVSYKLNLKGLSLNVQSGCSTSLVAVGMACQSLLSYQCDMALAGAASIQLPQKGGYLYEEGGILSPDGYCRAFDAAAGGTVGGNGVGVVVLKRLADALADGDYVHAVIKGSAINNDGSFKVGYTAPSVEGQYEVIAEALAMAHIDPATVGYVETHGTGTTVGDPIEFAALTKAFRASTARRNFCAIGSVKTNIGHLDAAAGIAGLIKTTLALKHKQLPPSLHFERPNPALGIEESPFYVSAKLSDWKTQETPRRAGVSSFGIGGTNAHVILEEAPEPPPAVGVRAFKLLTLSASTPSALAAAAANLAAHLREHSEEDLASVAYTLQVGRKAFKHRRFVVCRERDDALAALDAPEADDATDDFQEPRERPVAFVFPGQGTQYAWMARDLYRHEQTFREQVDLCTELLKPHLKLDLRETLYPEGDESSARDQSSTDFEINQTALTQPALFVVEYALAKLWMEWGVMPAAFIGQSIGEYVAACLAGVMSLADALFLVATRARLMQRMPPGSMLAISASEQATRDIIETWPELSLAAVNGPSRCVVSGTADEVGRLEERCVGSGIAARRLRTSHAFHSRMMEAAAEEFTAVCGGVALSPPRLPFISNLTGTWITKEQATDPAYWARQLRETVRFADGLDELSKQPEHLLLEVGAGGSSGTRLTATTRGADASRALSSLGGRGKGVSDVEVMLRSLGRLWQTGIKIDWAGFHAHERLRRMPLPTYPFERQRYWVESQLQLFNYQARPQETTPAATVDERAISRQPDESLTVSVEPVGTQPNESPDAEIEQTISLIWQEILGVEQVGVNDNFFELGGDSLVGIQLMSRLRLAFEVELPMTSLFESPTVAGLAAFVSRSRARQSPQEGDEEELEWMLAEIEKLSPEEIDAAISNVKGAGAEEKSNLVAGGK